MAAPLVLRIITDISQTLKANNSVISSNTLVGKSALDMGADIAKSAKVAVTSSVEMETQLSQLAAEYRRLATSATLSGREQAKAALDIADRTARVVLPEQWQRQLELRAHRLDDVVHAVD